MTPTTTQHEEPRGRPQDLHAETDLLCACLQESRWADLALQSVEVGDFAGEAHQTIFAAIHRLRQAGAEADAGSVASELRRVNAAPEVVTYAQALPAQWVPLGRQVEQRLATIRQQSALRQIITAAGDLRDRAFANPDDPAAMIESAIADLQTARAAWQPPQAAPLRTFAELDLLPAPSWAWPGWLANGHLSLLFGPPGAGKSYLALALCGSIVAGRPWPDGQPPAQPPATALLLDFEGTLRETLDRAKGMGLPLQMLLTQPEDSLPYLTRADSPQTIAQWIADSGARLLVVDSLRDALPGVDENDAAATAQALHGLKLVAQETDVAVLLLHHPRKQQAGGDGQARWDLGQDDLRGSSAIAGAVRTILAIDKPDAARQTRRLKLVKSNFGPMPEPLGFDLGEAGLEWTDAPFAGRNMPARSTATEVLKMALQGGPMRYSELKDILAERDISATTLKRVLRDMKQAQEVTQGQDGRWGLVSRQVA